MNYEQQRDLIEDLSKVLDEHKSIDPKLIADLELAMSCVIENGLQMTIGLLQNPTAVSKPKGKWDDMGTYITPDPNDLPIGIKGRKV